MYIVYLLCIGKFMWIWNIIRQRNLNLQMGDLAKLNNANSMYNIFHAFNL